MDEIIASANKEVLVEMVKFAQKKGMCGSKGSWKAFVGVHRDELGEKMRDPARSSIDSLVAFLRTFQKDDDLQFFKKVLQSYPNLDESMLLKNSPDNETPEQILLSFTRGHPEYQLEYSFPSNEEDWLVIDCEKSEGKSFAMLSVDCEMVSCDDGTEALVRICVIDENLQVKLDEFVNPSKAIADYRTEITGISAKDLDGVTRSLKDVQNSVKNFVSDGTILVGYSLNNALRALKLQYNRVIDIAYIFSYEKGAAKIPLNLLCKTVLGNELQKKGTPRNCLDDALAAMKLVLARAKGGNDGIIPKGTEMDKAVLLLHRVPAGVRSTCLLSVVPGAYAGALKVRKRSSKYTAFAIFKDEEEANEAFESLEGHLQKDWMGRPQKLVKFDLGTGLTCCLYVSKTHKDDATVHKLTTPKKDESLSEDEANACVVKELKKEKRRCEDEATDLVLKKPKKEERCKDDTTVHVVKQSKKDESLSEDEANACVVRELKKEKRKCEDEATDLGRKKPKKEESCKDDTTVHVVKQSKKDERSEVEANACVVKELKKEKRRCEDEATDCVLKKPKKQERCKGDTTIHVVKQSKRDVTLAQLKKQNEFGNHCERHLKEIETLKHELSKRDEEISNLKKTIIDISRKQVAS